MQKKSSSNLSFLDVLFGALGAVLILFIIMLSMSGAPPRLRTPINRSYKWEFTFPDDVSFSKTPLIGEILICNDNLDQIELDTPLNMTPISGKGFDCSATSEKPLLIDIGLVSVQHIIDTINRKNIVIVNLELTIEDESWIETLILKLNSNQWEKSKITISPGETSFSSKTIENANPNDEESFILSKVKLVDVDEGGKMPNINEYRKVHLNINAE